MCARTLRSGLTLATGLLVALAGSGCHTAEGWRNDADAEVQAVLADTLPVHEGEVFTIEPPPDPLRERLQAARAAGAPQPLELDLVDCLRVAAENSREWQDQREQLFRTALDLTLERWKFDPQWASDLSAGASGVGGQRSGSGGSFGFQILKLLGYGTRFIGNVGLDFVRTVGQGGGWSALSSLSLSITQPILRGFGSDIVKEPLEQAERDLLYDIRAYERFRHTFAVRIAQSFFQTLERVDRLKNEDANYANLTRLRERNESLAEAGRLTDIQVDQARQDELSAEDRLVAARRDLEGALDDFKTLLGLPIETELVLVENGLRSMEAWPSLAVELPEARVLETGLARRLDHRTTVDRIEDSERKAHVAADALRAGLDLSVTAATTGEGGRVSELEATDLVSFRVVDSAWSAGVGLDLPIDLVPERNQYRASLIALQASRRAAQASADEVTSDLRDALRRLDAARASYRIQSGSVVLAQRRVESAALNLDAGRASTRDVLEAQESLLSAQNTLAGALTDTILAGLFLYRDMELLEVTDTGIVLLREEIEGVEP